jgi:hypothetical protein
MQASAAEKKTVIDAKNAIAQNSITLAMVSSDDQYNYLSPFYRDREGDAAATWLACRTLIA